MLIEIWTKDKYAENEEKELSERLSRAGLDVKTAKLSRLYNVDAPWTKMDFSRLADGLLADRITERRSLARRPGLGDMYRVEVWLKKSATDVIGESVKEAIHDMLGRAPSGVRFGRAYYLAGRGSRKPAHPRARAAYALKIRAVVAKTLANEIVQTFTVE
jgi:phosphoribosylformylglycinamidine (FGAM) synthase PurS component